jgi:hypothetical protein
MDTLYVPAGTALQRRHGTDQLWGNSSLQYGTCCMHMRMPASTTETHDHGGEQRALSRAWPHKSGRVLRANKEEAQLVLALWLTRLAA